MSRQRTLYDLLILFLLPAPATGLLLILVAVYAIADGTLTDQGAESEVVAAEAAPALSQQALLIATANAAPPRLVVNAEVAQAYTSEEIAAGEQKYISTCNACHGPDLAGISGNGKTLVNSEFIRSQTDAQLMTFITSGRKPWDPGNTTGIEMPAMGGNPMFTANDVYDIIAYIRTVDGFVPPQDGSAGAEVASSEAAPAEEEAHSSVGENPDGSRDIAFTPLTGLVSSGGDEEAASEEASTEETATTEEATTEETTPSEPAAAVEGEGRSPEAIEAAMCVSYGGKTPCDYLKAEIAAGTDDETLTATLINGLSQFAAGNTQGINVPPGGGLFPPLTEAEIAGLLAFYRGEETAPAEEATSEEATEEATTEEAAPAQEEAGRSPEAIEAAMCGVSYGGQTPCDYLLAEIADGADDETLTATLINGLSQFAAGNTRGINVPPGGGLFPPLTEAEAQAFLEYLRAQ